MTRYLLDTNILRYYFESRSEVEIFFNNCRIQGDDFLISYITYEEIRLQMKNLDKLKRKELLEFLSVLPRTTVTSRKSKRTFAFRRYWGYVNSYHESQSKGKKLKKISYEDAAIAVDAVDEGVDIITHNTKDFHLARFLGVSLYDPVNEEWYYKVEKNREGCPPFIIPEGEYS